jgi:hypothetical protein
MMKGIDISARPNAARFAGAMLAFGAFRLATLSPTKRSTNPLKALEGVDAGCVFLSESAIDFVADGAENAGHRGALSVAPSYGRYVRAVGIFKSSEAPFRTPSHLERNECSSSNDTVALVDEIPVFVIHTGAVKSTATRRFNISSSKCFERFQINFRRFVRSSSIFGWPAKATSAPKREDAWNEDATHCSKCVVAIVACKKWVFV